MARRQTPARSLPDRVIWRQVIGIGVLGGIGFAMSLFITDLAFVSASGLETAKVGILATTMTTGITDALILPKRTPI